MIKGAYLQVNFGNELNFCNYSANIQSLFCKSLDWMNNSLRKSCDGYMMSGYGLVDWIVLLFSIQL